jgi:DNA-binding LacI/PurR family transcriptional regulator
MPRTIPNVALLVDWLDTGYQERIIRGAVHAARERHANLFVCAGGPFDDHDENGPARNRTYDLLAKELFDGLVLITGGLVHHGGEQALQRFLEPFRGVPICSLAQELPGTTSILIDNDVGMRSAMEHLSKFHGYRNIGFIKGAQGNPEAERRYAVYSESLEALGLSEDPRLVVDGAFTHEGGIAAVAEILDRRHVRVGEVHALLAANDTMALAAMQELARRKVRVPRDVAVVGFDDIEESRYTSPPLSTVRQPLVDQGRDAVRVVLDRALGLEQPEVVVHKTTLSVRRSCGCTGQGNRRPSLPPTRTGSFQTALVDRRQVLMAELSRAAVGQLAPVGAGWEARLVNALSDEFVGATPDAFIGAIDDISRVLLAADADVVVLHDVLSAVREGLAGALEASARARLEDAVQVARLLVSEASERRQASLRLETERWTLALARTSAALASSFDFAKLAQQVKSKFGLIDVRSCYVALFDDDAPGFARLVVAYDERHTEVPGMPTGRAPVAEIIRAIQKTGPAAWFLSTLYTDGPAFGFVLVELGVRTRVIGESLREFCSTAVAGALLAERLR